MSAYILNYDSIDVLVAAAAQRRYHSGPVSYIVTDGYEYERYEGPTSRDEKTALGRLLLEQNVKSVAYRYPKDAPGDWPGATSVDPAGDYEFPESLVDPLSPLRTLGVIDCYEYQSCEDPGWHTSRAKAFCDALRKRQIDRLRDVSDEDDGWSYTYPEGQDPRKDNLPKVISLSDLVR